MSLGKEAVSQSYSRSFNNLIKTNAENVFLINAEHKIKGDQINLFLALYNILSSILTGYKPQKVLF